MTLSADEIDTDRFWSRVDQSDGPDACWPWLMTDGRVTHGYGKLRVNGQFVSAHRIAYILEYGAVPPDLLVCHSCDHPWCVNAKHLWIGTCADNHADRDQKGRGNPGPGARVQRKLTPHQVREIRTRAAGDVSTRDALGQEYGVSGGTIWNVVRRRFYAEVS